MWSWSPATVTPDGGGISQGATYLQDCVGISANTATVTPSVTFSVTSSASSVTSATADIYGYGLRDCIGVSNASGLCDVGNGLTVIKSGVEYRDTNTLDFSGNLTLSSSVAAAVWADQKALTPSKFLALK